MAQPLNGPKNWWTVVGNKPDVLDGFMTGPLARCCLTLLTHGSLSSSILIMHCIYDQS